MIKVEIVADSVNSFGDRLTSLVLTYPRIIHSEMMTHRMFSRNASSSRAVPVDKMIKTVKENTFCPFEFQKSHKGMQGSEYFTGVERQECINLWLESAEFALQQAEKMKAKGISKQIINRILEPYQYYTVLLTGTEFENFFALRCPQYEFLYNDDTPPKYFKSKKELSKWYKDEFSTEENPYNSDLEWLGINKGQSEIHMQALAEAMYDAYNESTPKQLQAGGWHIPNLGHELGIHKLKSLLRSGKYDDNDEITPDINEVKLKISTSHCARISYTTLGDNPKIDYETDINLHDRLLLDKHMSPFEHCARAMNDEEYQSFRKGEHEVDLIDNSENEYWHVEADSGEPGWCGNYRGFIQYRHLVGKDLIYKRS